MLTSAENDGNGALKAGNARWYAPFCAHGSSLASTESGFIRTMIARWASGSGKDVFSSIPIPSKHGENLSVDDHSQTDSWPRTVGDCSAAERNEPEQFIHETSRVEVSSPKASFGGVLCPFVWQCGRRLLMLVHEQGQWVMAELEFDPEICRYSELQRAFYDWEREAVGAFLSRTLRYGDVAATESADLLDGWIRGGR